MSVKATTACISASISDRSVFTSVPGQSGQPESPRNGDLVALWGNYEYAPLVYSREAVERNTANKLVLEPR
jgi:penicillin amidase